MNTHGAFTLSALSPQADAIITRLFADILVSPEHKFESNLTAKEIKASTNARAWMRDKVVDVYMKILQRYLSEAGSSNIVLLSPDFYNSIGGTAQTGKALVDKENVCNGIHIAANFLAAERILVPAFLPSKSHFACVIIEVAKHEIILVDKRFAHEDNSKDDNGLLAVVSKFVRGTVGEHAWMTDRWKALVHKDAPQQPPGGTCGPAMLLLLRWAILGGRLPKGRTS